MRKTMAVAMVGLLCLGLVGGAAAAEWFKVETTPVNILGRPCAVVKTVRQGGPLNGFLGQTQVSQTLVTIDKDGGLRTLSSSAQQATGLGDKMVTGTFQNLGLGGMYALGQAIRTPDTTNVKQNVSGANAASGSTSGAATTVTNSNSNSLSQSQSQGQAQGGLIGINNVGD